MNFKQINKRHEKWALVDFATGRLGIKTYGRLQAGLAFYVRRDKILHFKPVDEWGLCRVIREEYLNAR